MVSSTSPDSTKSFLSVVTMSVQPPSSLLASRYALDKNVKRCDPIYIVMFCPNFS